MEIASKVMYVLPFAVSFAVTFAVAAATGHVLPGNTYCGKCDGTF